MNSNKSLLPVQTAFLCHHRFVVTGFLVTRLFRRQANIVPRLCSIRQGVPDQQTGRIDVERCCCNINRQKHAAATHRLSCIVIEDYENVD